MAFGIGDKKKETVEAASVSPDGGPQKKTASERAAERVAARKVMSEKLKADANTKLRAANKAFEDGPDAPLFVPYKNQDGSISPALVLDGYEDVKRLPNGDLEVNEETREAIPEYRFRVVVFSHLARDPFQADWKP